MPKDIDIGSLLNKFNSNSNNNNSSGDDNSGNGGGTIPSGPGSPINSDITAIITMNDADFLNYISDGRLNHAMLKNEPYIKNKAIFEQMKADFEVPVTVNIWQWASTNDSDFSKKTGTLTIKCNKYISEIVKAVFNDIYNNPNKPVINSYEGCWVPRGIDWKDEKNPSAHSYGCAIDLNAKASVGGFTNGKVKNGTPSKAQWEQLPECHAKYEIFYEESPVVLTFKKYGFYWGGEFSTNDGMHFGMIGDYINSATDRSKHGIPNYNAYKDY